MEVGGLHKLKLSKIPNADSPKMRLIPLINNHGDWQGLHIRATAPVFDPPAKIAVEDRGYLG